MLTFFIVGCFNAASYFHVVVHSNKMCVNADNEMEGWAALSTEYFVLVVSSCIILQINTVLLNNISSG